MADDESGRLRNPWIVLVVLLAIYTVSFADRYLLTGLVGPVKTAFGIDDGYVGLLMGPAFIVLYVLAGIPIARLADRGSRVVIIATGCTMWSLCTVATGLAQGPLSLTLARIGVGIGEAAFAAPAFSLLHDYFRRDRRILAIAILNLATMAGLIIGQAGGPVIAAASSWRVAFVAMGAVGLALATLAIVVVREPPRGARVAATPVLPLMEIMHRMAQARSYVLLMVGNTFATMSGVAFGFWGPELFTRVYRLDPVAAKSGFALNFGTSGLAGMLAFGALASHLARRDALWPVRLAAISIAGATISIVMTIWSSSHDVALLWAIPCGLLGGGWAAGLIAGLQHLLPDSFRATGTAVFLAFFGLLGYATGPWSVGMLSSMLGDNASSLRLALSIVVPVGFIGALASALAIGRIASDARRLADA